MPNSFIHNYDNQYHTHTILVDLVDAQHAPLPNDESHLLVRHIGPRLDNCHLDEDVISLVVAHRHTEIPVLLPALVHVHHGPVGIVRRADLLAVDGLELVAGFDAGQGDDASDLVDEELGLGPTKGRGAAEAAPAAATIVGRRITEGQSPIDAAHRAGSSSASAGMSALSIIVVIDIGIFAGRPTLGSEEGHRPQKRILGIVHDGPNLRRQRGGDGAGLRGRSGRSPRDGRDVDLLDAAGQFGAAWTELAYRVDAACGAHTVAIGPCGGSKWGCGAENSRKIRYGRSQRAFRFSILQRRMMARWQGSFSPSVVLTPAKGSHDAAAKHHWATSR